MKKLFLIATAIFFSVYASNAFTTDTFNQDFHSDKLECNPNLKELIGDSIHEMHIIEINSGKPIASSSFYEHSLFASFTKIPLNSAKPIRKQLRIVKNWSAYDLLLIDESIWKFFQKNQIQEVEEILSKVPYGYIALNKSTHYSAHVSELIQKLMGYGRKGKVIINQEGSALLWKPVDDKPQSRIYQPKEVDLSISKKRRRMITYAFSGGRLGDNLLAYLHAKWISMKNQLPLLYKPFKYSEYFRFSQQEKLLGNKTPCFKKIRVSDEKQFKKIIGSVLFELPYFPECKFEYDMLNMKKHKLPFFTIDWEDPLFEKEVKAALQPVKFVDTLSLPEGHLTVAIHVRRGGSYESYAQCEKNYPLKFPPDQYFIDNLQRIAEIYPGKKLYVYLFTDDEHPEVIVKHYVSQLNHLDITFDWYKKKNKQDYPFLLSDFFSMAKFDCLIRGTSNFSSVAAKLGNYCFEVKPTHGVFINQQLHIDGFEVFFKSKAGASCP